MITNGEITIWSDVYNPEKRMNTWKRVYSGPVSMQWDTNVTVVNNGIESADVIKIRIPTDDFIDIKNGSKVAAPKADEITPPPDAKIVIGFADNRKGSHKMHHWKVVCK